MSQPLLATTVVCEGCGFSEDLLRPSTDMRGWAKVFRQTPDGIEDRGDVCSICFAAERAGTSAWPWPPAD